MVYKYYKFLVIIQKMKIRQHKSIHSRKKSQPSIIINKVQSRQKIVKQTLQISKVKSRYEQIKSARVARTRKLSNELPYLQPTQSLKSSNSKFSQRHKNIILSRTNMVDFDIIHNNDEQRKQRVEKKLYGNLQTKNHLNDNIFGALLNVNQLQKVNPQIRKSGKRFLQHQHITDSNNYVRIQKDIQYIALPKLNEDELIFKIQSIYQNNLKENQLNNHQKKDNQLTGYWKTENKFVSLTVLEKNQRLDFNHCNILPIYAQITINNLRYVVSDQYKNFSLKHLIDQFGPFDEDMSKRYLKQIVQGLQHMHYHKCGHNRLTSRAILYNKNGNIFINSINATSLLLSTKQLSLNKQLHYFSPEFLLSKSFTTKSLKNDIWALGCIALEMFHFNIQYSKYHPYKFTTFKDQNEERMIDNLRQIIKNYFLQNEQNEKIKNNYKQPQIKLSEAAINFIFSCLQIIPDHRSTIQQLLQHQFFQGV